MDDNELMSIISDWNFWGNLSRKNWIKRNEYVNYIVNLLKGINIIAISGIRRSGKSIISLQVIEELINRGIDPKDTLIIKLDDERLINPDYELLLRIFDLYLNNIKANSNSPISYRRSTGSSRMGKIY
ncbi:AAA family ATPase [Acidianus brierleyi]|uniref:AAA family ATPase n=1 Tax=Acidianus brierleyi TaxID=41673 RepID=UPI00248363F0|nr:AAA family ATPase [Acidianus brierleyi]